MNPPFLSDNHLCYETSIDLPSPVTRPSTPEPCSRAILPLRWLHTEFTAPTTMMMLQMGQGELINSTSPLILDAPPLLSRYNTDPLCKSYPSKTPAEVYLYDSVVHEISDIFSQLTHYNLLLALIPYDPQLVPTTDQQLMFLHNKLYCVPSICQAMSKVRNKMLARHPGPILVQRITNSFLDLMINLDCYMKDHLPIHTMIKLRHSSNNGYCLFAPPLLFQFIEMELVQVRKNMIVCREEQSLNRAERSV